MGVDAAWISLQRIIDRRIARHTGAGRRTRVQRIDCVNLLEELDNNGVNSVNTSADIEDLDAGREGNEGNTEKQHETSSKMKKCQKKEKRKSQVKEKSNRQAKKVTPMRTVEDSDHIHSEHSGQAVTEAEVGSQGIHMQGEDNQLNFRGGEGMMDGHVNNEEVTHVSPEVVAEWGVVGHELDMEKSTTGVRSAYKVNISIGEETYVEDEIA